MNVAFAEIVVDIFAWISTIAWCLGFLSQFIENYLRNK
jgi:hypothetical protein